MNNLELKIMSTIIANGRNIYKISSDLIYAQLFLGLARKNCIKAVNDEAISRQVWMVTDYGQGEYNRIIRSRLYVNNKEGVTL